MRNGVGLFTLLVGLVIGAVVGFGWGLLVGMAL